MTEFFLLENSAILGADFSLKVAPPENYVFSGGDFWRRYRPFLKFSYENFNNFRLRRKLPLREEKSWDFSSRKSRKSTFKFFKVDFRLQSPAAKIGICRFWRLAGWPIFGQK